MFKSYPFLTLLPLLAVLLPAAAFAQLPPGNEHTNSLGMRFVRIQPGTFSMGESNTVPDELTLPLSYPTRDEMEKRYPWGDPGKFRVTVDHVRRGDFDEKPVRSVTLTRPYLVGATEVTNAQYEAFDPNHRALRGKQGFSREDDEAAVFINWHEANAFCQWLSKKEGVPYRLPTEAEWEYAARAGTRTVFSTGNSLPPAFHKNPVNTSFTSPADVVTLLVGRTPANPWGLFDMHGNVEEWCSDWYGPYVASAERDPVGRAGGEFKVTRGGSHGTPLYYLRSANRLGAPPETRNWLIGFRVVIGETPASKPLPLPATPPVQRNVKQTPPPASTVTVDQPYFRGPRRYVRIAPGSHGPLYYHHNHDPAITECPNGDLFAIWYTCAMERGRELAIAASRLRAGSDEWDIASEFWDAPDRNDHCPALWFDGDRTMYHINGLGAAGRWEPLAIILRTSTDSGATWSPAKLIAPEFGFRNMVGQPFFRAPSGEILFGADAGGGSTVWVSRDNGTTWEDAGGRIRGVHAAIAPLKDGRLLAFGRGEDLDGWMPRSVSSDLGRSWTSSPSGFQPITGGQRATMIRLKDGSLFFASFAKNPANPEPVRQGGRNPRQVSSIFGALSFDEGNTWPVRRVIARDEPEAAVPTIDGGLIRMSPATSEPQGYLASVQSRDGLIHLISSTNHYAFNVAWLKQNPPPVRALSAGRLPSRTSLAAVYEPRALPQESKPAWHVVGSPGASPGGSADISAGSLNLRADKGQSLRWNNERTSGFAEFRQDRGFTVEARVRVLASADPARAFDLEAYAAGGALTSNHYLLRITPSEVHYWHDNRFMPVAGQLDNSSASQTFRMAVRDDTAVEIYRNGDLLAVMPADTVIDWRQPARGSYLEWGSSSAGVEAHVERIAWDAGGAFRPAAGTRSR